MRKSISELLAEKRANESGAALQDMMQRGIAASEAGDKETANNIFRQVAEQYPNNLEVWVWLGWTSADLDDAEASFAEARRIDPNNEEAALGLRWVTSQRAEQPQAPAVPETPTVEEPAPVRQEEPADYNMAPVAPMAPSTATEMQYEMAPRQASGPNAAEMMQQAIEAIQRGDKSGAYRMFEHVASVQSSDPDVWVWLGGTSNSLDDAESAFRRARELDPSNEKATLGLRWVALRRQVAYAAAMPAVPVSAVAQESASEPAPRKENVFTRFFKRFGKAS